MVEEAHPAARSLTSDSGIVTGWLVKVVVFLGLAALILLEGGLIVLNRVTAADTARKAATEGGFAFQSFNNLQDAERAAEAEAEKEGATLVSFTVDTNARTATATVGKRAKTLFVHNIGALRRYTRVTVAETVPLATS